MHVQKEEVPGKGKSVDGLDHGGGGRDRQEEEEEEEFNLVLFVFNDTIEGPRAPRHHNDDRGAAGPAAHTN